MFMLVRILLIFIICAFFQPMSLAYQRPDKNIGFDLVIMKNGDYHHGAIVHEVFHLKTDYGLVSIPYLLMSELYISRSVEKLDHVITHFGDLFSGKLQGREINIMRTQQPILPLHTDDIANIQFNRHKLRNHKYSAHDAVELRNGDHFMVEVKLTDLMIKTKDAIHLISHEDIYFLDFAQLIDGEKIKVQVIKNDGQIIQGELMTVKQFKVNNRYNQMLSLPLEQLVTLAYHVNYQNGMSDYNYRSHLSPASLFQDYMVDGTPAPKVIALRGGAYMKGDHQGNGDVDEQPVVVNKPKPFAIGLYEITFEEYDLFCEDTRRKKPDDSGWGRGKRPVINVSWKDAVAYTEWLSRKTHQTYRLPSDSEWEYAARAGTTTRYWWGNDTGNAKANCEGCGSLWDGEKTAVVGKFRPNPFGLHDTAGNVFEWVADCLHSSFSKAPIDASPLDKPGCGKRVIRGGAWSFPAKEIRSANRWRDFPSRTSDDTGFRIVRELK